LQLNQRTGRKTIKQVPIINPLAYQGDFSFSGNVPVIDKGEITLFLPGI